jgi:hypothetical protein
VLVLDWGIAKTSSPEPDLPGSQSDVADTRHGVIIGTPGYMAPEQATGQSATADARADGHGLGGILAAMFAGNKGGRPLAAIVAKAQAVSPEARCQTATELAADVRCRAAGMPVRAYRENVVERVRRLAQQPAGVVAGPGLPRPADVSADRHGLMGPRGTRNRPLWPNVAVVEGVLVDLFRGEDILWRGGDHATMAVPARGRSASGRAI